MLKTLLGISCLMNNKIFKILVVIFYLAIFFLKYDWLSWSFFVSGFLFGYLFYYLDFLLYPIYADQNLEIVKIAKQYWGQKNWKHYVRVLIINQTHLVGLMTRSLLFISIFLPLAIFILNTSQYAFGKALVLGLGLKLVFDLFEYKNQPQVFNQVFRGQFDLQLSLTQINRIVWIFTSVFFAISILSLI